MAKKTRRISEYGGKETYSSKAAMRRHERAESPAVERREKRAEKRATAKKKKR